MTKPLYEEALADMKKMREVATADAQRSVLAVVAPRIRELIESELLKEESELGADTEDLIAVSDPFESPVSTSVEPTSVAVGVGVVDAGAANAIADAITPPDATGKVTLDLDAVNVDPAGVPVEAPVFGEEPEEFELSLESLDALRPVLKANKANNFKNEIASLGETVSRFKQASKIVRESSGYRSQIKRVISQIQDKYEYLQEHVVDPAVKSSYEAKLESYFSELNRLTEQTMSKVSKSKMINEEDVTLKLTGLPDDVDLDQVGVDLLTGEDDEEVEVDLDAEDAEGEGDDLDLGDLGSEGGEDEELAMGESLAHLSDDTVVEIDEAALRSEIKRMRKLREEAVPSTKGSKPGADEFDDFGGACDEGEALAEDDEPKEDEVKLESLRRRIAFEQRVQERAKVRAVAIKKEAARASARRDAKKYAQLKSEYAQAKQRFVESVRRESNAKAVLVESTKKGSIDARQNGSSKRLAESQVAQNLRSKLAETNLNNAKLTYSNKVLQIESLNSCQKERIIKRLEETKTVREAKQVYDGLVKALNESSSRMNEGADRKVLGSASRAVRSSSSSVTLNEGVAEADRWAKLAGLTK